MPSWIPSLFNPFTDDDSSAVSEPSDDLSAVFSSVTALLAPPSSSSSSPSLEGIKNDLAEIQGSLRSGISLISSKLTSNFMQLQNQFNDGDDDEDEDEALGISDETLEFVLKISTQPQIWTKFPLPLTDDFDMSDSQREHAANIDHLVPEFATLRQKICSQVSEAKFWLIYFIMLLPRLDEEDLKFLSSPQVAEATETLMKKFQHKKNENQETSENSDGENSKGASQHMEVPAATVNMTNGTENVDETESTPQSKEVDTHPSNDIQNQSEDEDEEDVSFSDLEDDDNDLPGMPSEPKLSTSNRAWVGLGESSKGLKDKDSDSEDWVVDDSDF